jgi:hypothetical protein
VGLASVVVVVVSPVQEAPAAAKERAARKRVKERVGALTDAA